MLELELKFAMGLGCFSHAKCKSFQYFKNTLNSRMGLRYFSKKFQKPLFWPTSIPCCFNTKNDPFFGHFVLKRPKTHNVKPFLNSSTTCSFFA